MTDAADAPPNFLQSCARALEQDAENEELNRDVRQLLSDLEYLPPSGAVRSSRNVPHAANLLRAASRFVRIFELGAPEAPGLVFFGAEVHPSIANASYADQPAVGVSGTGLVRRLAFESCVGEGVEYLSQFESDNDEVLLEGVERQTTHSPALCRYMQDLLQFRSEPARDIGWIAASRLTDGKATFLPADICLRRRAADKAIIPPFPLGTGCAAGPTFEAAALHGLLELIERDAVSLWWRGGRRGHAIPERSEAGQHARSLLTQIRQGVRSRDSWLIDITTDIGIPCVAAVSAMSDGFGFACGHAARLTVKAAVQSAIMEMCQIELAHSVVEAKRHERGDAALNERDLGHLRRRTQVDTRTCILLHPLPPRDLAPELIETNPGHALRCLVGRLAGMGFETFAVDLTRSAFAIPVVRIVAPGLQLEPSGIVTDRLTNTRTETGGGCSQTGGVALL